MRSEGEWCSERHFFSCENLCFKFCREIRRRCIRSLFDVVDPFTPAGDKKLLAPEMPKPYNPKSVGALTSGPTKSKFNPHFQSYFSRCSFDRPSSSVAIRFLNPGRKSFSLAGYVGQMAVNASVEHSVRSWGWPCHYCISAENPLHSTVWLMMGTTQKGPVSSK